MTLLIGVLFFFFDAHVQAQTPDALARAKAAYASAAFEDALALLSGFHDKAPPESSEAGAYEAFCLVALGREDDARRAVETIVRNDPEYRLTDAQAPPRVRALFDAVRVRLLPAIARASYGSGRAAFDRKDFAMAVKDLGRAVALIEELATKKSPADPGLIELLPLASGFKDLAVLSAAQAAAAIPPANPSPAADPPAPAPAPIPTPPPVAAASAQPEPAAIEPKVSKPRTFGPEDAGVKAPVLVGQSMPPWQPETPAERATKYHGYLSLVIDERGRVEAATLLGSIHKRYDGPLLEAVPHWTFRPALKDGVAVRYRYLMLINLTAK
jgi:tetratricopeptide (TPR) repeat protein